jgi:DNA primase
MTGRITDEKVEEVRARADIVEVVSSYLNLRRSGGNHVGLCPFHAEKTPSFNVNGARQVYHCFGCGVGGDVFSFVMNMEGLTFPEAVRRLGERYGVEIEEEIVTPEQEQRRQERDRLLRVMEVACDFYQQLLLEDPSGRPARAYLRQRGFDGELARQHRLGWAPASWEALAKHLRAKGFEPQWARDRLGLIRAGREGRGDYDLFRRRLLFPILDERGRPVAFGGRILEGDGPKYINSPESSIYHKGRVLYGLYQARDAMRHAGTAIVVEGYFDQLALSRAGFHNAVATCGTALTPEHVGLLKRFAERVLLLFDQDAAGRKATFRAMDVLLPAGLRTSVVTLEPGDDPDSFLRERDAGQMGERLEAARPVLEVFVEQTLAEHGEDIANRARAVENILAKVRLLPGAIERDLYLKDLSVRTGLDEPLLRSRLRPPQRRGEIAARPVDEVSRPPARPALPTRPTQDGTEFKAQRLLLGLMCSHGAARREALRVGLEDMFGDADFRFIAAQVLESSAQDGPVDEKKLQENLNEVQKGLLSGILIEDEALFAENPEAQFTQCRRTVHKERIKRQLDKLRARMREAEKVRDATLHAELQRQWFELQKLRRG